VHPRAEHPLKPFGESGEAVEIFAKARAGFFGVNEPDVEAVFDSVSECLQEGNGTIPGFDVQVFDIGGADPQGAFCLKRVHQHVAVVILVGDVSRFHYPSLEKLEPKIKPKAPRA